MAHKQQIDFCKSVKQHLPSYFSNHLVIDIGSLDINGNNQYLFDDCLYLGIDLLQGRNVDIATVGHELRLPDESVDVIISTECFEHDQFYSLTLKNIIRMLKPGGLLVFSCATTGRPEHGTRRTTPADAPFIQDLGEWSDYYKNLEETDIRQVLDVDVIFEKYAFEIGMEVHDLYFWGVKKGTLIDRHDYSFQIQQASFRADLKTREIFVVDLLATVNERDRQISDVLRVVTERDGQIAELSQAVNVRHRQISDGIQVLAERDGQIAELSQAVNVRDSQISDGIQVVAERDVQIAGLNHAVNERDRQISDGTKAVTERDRQIVELSQCVADFETKLNIMINSNSLRLTKPLRFLVRMLRGELNTIVFRGITVPLITMETVLRQARDTIGYVIKGDFKGLNERYRARRKIIMARRKHVSIDAIQSAPNMLPEQKCWGIIATQHTQFISQIIASCLREHDWKVDIMTEVPDSFHHDWYVVICPQMFKKLPPGEKRIVFQMEQSVSSRWFTDDYLQTLENSLAVLEYALVNIDFMASKGVAYPHVHYLPVGASSIYFNSHHASEKTCDILFYGDSKSSLRRREMLDALSQHFDVRIVNEVFGHDMREAIKQARLVINLHYYDNALLEMPRIQECLSLGVPVVSESAQDQKDYPELVNAVRFFEQGSIPAMLNTVKDVLENPISGAEIEVSVAQSGQRFAFMFDRFLVAMGFLPSSEVNRMRLHLPASANRVALSLPETIERRRIFEIERPANCAVFDGIRRRPGWVGCGLSYMALATHAMKNGVNRLTVMEDDVILPPDFENKFAIVEEFLDARPEKWDIFAGIIASLHSDVKIIAVDVYKDITFVTINKMTSTVFNVYSKKALDLLATWDPEDLDSASNTIDRLFETQTNLRVVVALPFFVGHREEAHSTLWGFQNTQYNEMIAISEKSLKSMVLANAEKYLLAQPIY